MPLFHKCVYRIPYALPGLQGTRRPASAVCRHLRTKPHYHSTKHDTPSLELHMPYFDAERFAMLLEKEGFSASQSRAVINALDDVVDESTVNVTDDLVTKAEQQQTITQYKSDFRKLKSDIQRMENNDVEDVKSANERLKADIEKLKKTLQEELVRSQAGVRLDLNLEKGRIRDETVEQHDRLKNTDEKIANEIHALKTQMQGIKMQILRYMIGTITGAGTLVLGYIHFSH
ncbi:hypothetical protein BCR42DRAFT_420058 [Absidia repens]|uniref:DUF1640-domain-containing protein n=1 Tax=Absidia repens TaxID=90262 RepID=A0A1X2IAQ4_9FUNG|nr:hypothetical protein BCR42DRAFT_420058 [Absidia repens]